MLLRIWYYPHLPLSLSLGVDCGRTHLNPKPELNQSSARCRIVVPSSLSPSHQFHTDTALPTTATPLAWICLWHGLGTVRCCLMHVPHWEVWSADARYEQLLSLIAGCAHACMYTSHLHCLYNTLPVHHSRGQADVLLLLTRHPHSLLASQSKTSACIFLKGQLSIFVSNIFVRN